MNLMSRFPLVLVGLLACLPALAGERVLTLDPETTDVAFFLKATGHDVEGQLYLESGEIRFDPETGAASGRLIIDVARSDTGNKKRDKTMLNKVFEVASFPRFVFEPERIEGEVALDGTSEFDLVGTMSIHGEDHPFTMHTTAEISAGHVTARTSFPVPYVEWGLHNPSVFILRVGKVADVTVAAQGSLSGSATLTKASRD